MHGVSSMAPVLVQQHPPSLILNGPTNKYGKWWWHVVFPPLIMDSLSLDTRYLIREFSLHIGFTDFFMMGCLFLIPELLVMK